MASKNFSRQELYELVWTISVKQITEDYLVSFKSFKKICSDNKIPLPPNGYWSKKSTAKNHLLFLFQNIIQQRRKLFFTKEKVRIKGI